MPLIKREIDTRSKKIKSERIEIAPQEDADGSDEQEVSDYEEDSDDSFEPETEKCENGSKKKKKRKQRQLQIPNTRSEDDQLFE